MTGKLTHLDASGRARMVDVSDKPDTLREAVAEGFIRMSPATLELALSGQGKKGAVGPVAELAGVMAAKQTAHLIPLCHPIAVHGVDVDVTVVDDGPYVEILATVRTADRTGVEMEALTAVAVGGLTVIDMVKGRDRNAAITEVVLLEKLGGRSGHWTREQ